MYILCGLLATNGLSIILCMKSRFKVLSKETQLICDCYLRPGSAAAFPSDAMKVLSTWTALQRAVR